MVPSGILMNFEHPFYVLFFGLSHLFLAIIKIDKITFVVILFIVSVVIKNHKKQKSHTKLIINLQK